jgi:hypothetical protein
LHAPPPDVLTPELVDAVVESSPLEVPYAPSSPEEAPASASPFR